MSIRLRLTIILLSLVSIPLLFVSFITFRNYESSLEAARLTQLQDVARFKAERIEAYFAELTDDMEMAQKFYSIRKCLPLLARPGADLRAAGAEEAHALLDPQLSRMRGVLGLSDIVLVNDSGAIVYMSNPGHRPAYLTRSLTELWPVASNAPKDSIHITDLFLSAATGNNPEMLVMAPVSDLANVPIGTIVFEVNTTRLYALIQDTIGLGLTGEVLLCRRLGNDVAYLNPLRHDAGAALERRVPLGSPVAIPAQKALRGETGIGRSIDYRGAKVIAAWRQMPALEWGLVAKIDSREAFAVVTNLRRLVVLILFVALAISSIIAFSVAESISRPIRALSQGAALIGQGNLDYKVGTATKDEIGQLSRAFDAMIGDLKATTASRDELNREVAERKKAEDELLRSNKDLEQFAYVASHDLQEPLRAVGGFMGILKKQYGGGLNDEAREYIDLAVGGAERMQRLIHDLLAFSRVGTKGGTFLPVDLAEAFDAAVANLRMSVDESDASLTHGDLPTVVADGLQMTQLLQNLIGNAIKFRGERRPEIRVDAIRKDHAWVIRVSDNGIGMEPQYFERIFQIFQRLHSRTKYQGTGIGLALCKKIVERHGGAIWVESVPGEGSTFSFTIPDKGDYV